MTTPTKTLGTQHGWPPFATPNPIVGRRQDDQHRTPKRLLLVPDLPGSCLHRQSCPPPLASLLFLLLLLLLLPLGELAGPDHPGRPRRGCLVGRQARRGKHAHEALVLGVLGVLARRDELGQPGRALEEHDEERGARAGPVVQRLGGVAAPLVEDKPDGLLGREVGVPAVGPEASADEPAV